MMSEAPDIRPSDLDGYAAVAHILGERPLSRFDYVHSFYFTAREDLLGESWRDIELVMRELDAPRQRIGFRFHRATNVSYSGFGQILGLYIQSIQDRGWEGLRYEVGDYENGEIRLYCHSVTLYDPTKRPDLAVERTAPGSASSV